MEQSKNSFADAFDYIKKHSEPYILFSDEFITLENFKGKLPDGYSAIRSNEQEVDEIKDESNSFDYTKNNSEFPFHIDGGYYQTVPRYFVLYCVDPGTTGGEIILSDSNKVISRLYDKYDANFLDTIKSLYMGRDDSLYEKNLIETSPDNKNIKILNWNTSYFVPDLENLSIPNRRNYTYMLGDLIQDIRQYLKEEIIFNQRLQEGQGIIVDNHMLLHSRSAYDGTDRLVYRMMIDKSDFNLIRRDLNKNNLY